MDVPKEQSHMKKSQIIGPFYLKGLSDCFRCSLQGTGNTTQSRDDGNATRIGTPIVTTIR